MERYDPIPENDTITRWIKRKYLAADDNGEIEVDQNGIALFIHPDAFNLRPDEEYLSTTWVEHFGPDRPTNLCIAAEAVRSSNPSGRLAAKSVFACAVVSAVKLCGNEFGHRLRIILEPENDNSGHAAVLRYPSDPGELQDRLANDIFRERHFFDNLSL